DVSANIMGVPQDRAISRIECGHFAEGTAYVTIDRHRNDDRKPYVFKTTDYGVSWVSLSASLPSDGPVHVIRQSSRNKDLLFAGPEFALFASLDGGTSWHRVKGLPTVPVHDLVIHPRERDLVIGTHGRSIYVMDIGPLEELTPQVLGSAAHVFSIRPAMAFTWQKEAPDPTKSYVAPNPPYGATVWFYLKDEPAQAPTVTITDSAGKKLGELAGAKQAGLQAVIWNLTGADGRTVVAAGECLTVLRTGATLAGRKVRVEAAE